MNSVTISLLVVPAVVALLLFLVFTYLYEQTRQDYFRAWQLGWGAYTLHYILDAWSAFRNPSRRNLPAGLAASGGDGALHLHLNPPDARKISPALVRRRGRPGGSSAQPLESEAAHGGPECFIRKSFTDPRFRLEVGVALVLLYCSFFFYRYAHRKNSLAFTLLAMALALWSVLMLFGQFSNSYLQLSDMLGPIPQLALGIAMVMVLAENERNAVQENALAFSTLGVDPTRLLSAEDLVPSMQSILDRLVAPLPAGGAVICISERWRAVLPSVQRGFSAEFLEQTGEERSRRIRLRAGLPARRIRDLPQRAGNARTLAGISRRPLPAISRGDDRRAHLQRHGREPADPGTQFRRDPVSRTRRAGCSAHRTCGC